MRAMSPEGSALQGMLIRICVNRQLSAWIGGILSVAACDRGVSDKIRTSAGASRSRPRVFAHVRHRGRAHGTANEVHTLAKPLLDSALPDFRVHAQRASDVDKVSGKIRGTAYIPAREADSTRSIAVYGLATETVLQTIPTS